MKYKIIVDKQSRTNPSSEKKEYEIDIEELRCKGNVYDSLIITKDEDYVMRRLHLSEYHVLTILDEPVKEPLQDINIELFEGDNYIYLIDMTGNKFYAEYLVKNDLTDTFVSKTELNTAINQTSQEIELSVIRKLEQYSTTEETKALIQLLSDAISLEVSKKVGDDEIIAKFNMSPEQILLNGNKIDISGKKVNFKTNIESEYTFSQQDLTNIQKYLTGEGTLSPSQKELYDVNKDGVINSADLLKIQKAIMFNNGKYVIKGSFQIDPDSAERSIILRDEEGNIITSIGLLGMQTDSFSTNDFYSENANINSLSVAGILVKNEIEALKERLNKIEGGN